MSGLPKADRKASFRGTVSVRFDTEDATPTTEPSTSSSHSVQDSHMSTMAQSEPSGGTGHTTTIAQVEEAKRRNGGAHPNFDKDTGFFVGMFETISIHKAIRECIEKGVVLDYEYHKGSDTHGGILRDYENIGKVNAFAEYEKWSSKVAQADDQLKDAEGKPILPLPMEDGWRWIQIFFVCCYYVVENEMCLDLGDFTCDLLSQYYAECIRITTVTIPKL